MKWGKANLKLTTNTFALIAVVAVSVLTGCQLQENSMDYFQNESEVMILKGENHDLNIENRTDRVSLYGSVDITRDAQGLEQALRLKGVVDGMVAALNEEQGRGVLPDKVVLSTGSKAATLLSDSVTNK